MVKKLGYSPAQRTCRQLDYFKIEERRVSAPPKSPHSAKKRNGSESDGSLSELILLRREMLFFLKMILKTILILFLFF